MQTSNAVVNGTKIWYDYNFIKLCMYMYIALRTEKQTLFQMIYHYKRQILSWALVDQFDFHALALNTAFLKLIQQVQIDNYHVIGNRQGYAMKVGGGVAKRVLLNSLLSFFYRQSCSMFVCGLATWVLSVYWSRLWRW